ncbi:GTPase-activating protein [Thalassotalea sp. LPB0316]|uniref:Der GTPase-activating protein YihI n=1 Tax=Thalassotalea sp. LPB0316 TaxID=2769490 RepID=UPI00186716F2|nr:Der GTPase-activating protein YihI [Thalassotalea sp. LPB0316]QOL26181.1 GTPase-activating protein [Thalassotalea sp. LPB0316]
MTRKKKSRKPGRGSSGVIKTDANSTFDVEKRIRKKTGNKPGTRQQVTSKKQAQSNQTNKDTRIGSKKPIALIKTTTPTTQVKSVKPSILPKVIAVNATESADAKLWQELEQIEQHPELLSIVEKMDHDQALQAHEVDLYNKLMARHQEISDKLGIDHDEEDAVESDDEPLSEDALWQKFNDDKFDFE